MHGWQNRPSVDAGNCQSGDHVVGEIAGKTIRKSGWGKGVSEFETVVHDFNVRGQRGQIAHPGWCIKFKFCPCCGQSLADLRADLKVLFG